MLDLGITRHLYFCKLLFWDLIIFDCFPKLISIFHTASLLRESNAFWKSTKDRNRDIWYYVPFQLQISHVLILSTHELYFLKLACSLLSLVSTTFLILFNTLLTINDNMMPLHLLHSEKSSYLGRFTSKPFYQSSDSVTSSHIYFNYSYSVSVVFSILQAQCCQQ